jgi:tetratricopeptide (TPR) repeat protein
LNRAAVYIREEKFDDAIADYKKTIEANPNSFKAYVGEASAYRRKKDYSQAAACMKKLAEISSTGSDVALNSLAWFLATCPDSESRNATKAIEAAEKACELSQWKSWGYVDTLAAAYAEAGDFDQAIKYQELALKMAPAESEKVQGAKQRLELYKQRKPFRQELSET